MPRLHLPGILLLLALCVPACAANLNDVIVPGGIKASHSPSPSSSPDAASVSAQALLKAQDADHDGSWSMAEFYTWLLDGPVVPTWGPCPTPQPSGKETPAVQARVLASGQASAQTGVSVAPQCQLPTDAPGVFGRLDQDGDRRLSSQELSGFLHDTEKFKLDFAARDLNGDGAISLDEYVKSAPPQNLPPGAGAMPPPPELSFKAFDKNQDNQLSLLEFAAGQILTLPVPTAADLSGTYLVGSSDEPPTGPMFGQCGPGRSLTLKQSGTQVTGNLYTCGGPCFLNSSDLTGSNQQGELKLTGTERTGSQVAPGPVTIELRYDAKTRHLVGTKNGQPYWAVPYVQVESTQPGGCVL